MRIDVLKCRLSSSTAKHQCEIAQSGRRLHNRIASNVFLFAVAVLPSVNITDNGAFGSL